MLERIRDEGGDGTEITSPTDNTAPSGEADIRHGGAPAQAPAGHVPGVAHADGPEGPDSTASRIATSLTESTRPLLDSVSTRIDGLTGEERLALLARALLATVPRDCDSHLLWAALANFSVRAPDASPALRDSFRQFREQFPRPFCKIAGIQHSLYFFFVHTIGSFFTLCYIIAFVNYHW